MIKGKSYITITDTDNPDHPLIKELLKRGLRDIQVVYASHWATDAGWTMVKSNRGSMWLGYTIDKAIGNIKTTDF